MTKTDRIGIPLIVLGFLAVFAFALFNLPIPAAEASTDSGAYDFKVFTSANASSTAPFVVRTVEGQFGSLVVASSSAARIRIYDSSSATSTGATLIADFKAGIAEGTYTFDVEVHKGIVIDVPSTHSGAYTITHRR